MMASINDDTPASTSVASSSPSHNFEDILVNAFPAYGSTFASTSAAPPQPTRSGRVPHPPPEEELASMLAMDNYFEFPSEDETDDEDFVLPPAEEDDDLEEFLLQFGQDLPPLPPPSPQGKRKAETTPPPPSRRSKKDDKKDEPAPKAKRAKVPPLSPGTKAAIRRQRNADSSKAHRERQKEKEQELKIQVEELMAENAELKKKLAEAEGRQFSLEDVGKLMAVVMKGSSQ
jgi:hypothetical protein